MTTKKEPTLRDRLENYSGWLALAALLVSVICLMVSNR